MLCLGSRSSSLSLIKSNTFYRGILSLQRKAQNPCFSTGISRISQFTCSEANKSRCLPKAHQMLKAQETKLIHVRHTHEQSKWTLVYEGPLSKPVKYVKTFSLTTALASLVGSPILVYFGKQSVPLVGKLAIAGLLCLVGTSTTFILHWFTKAYVHRMYFNPSQKTFSADTLSFLGRHQRTEFHLDDVVFPKEESAFSTFEANGKLYFIHQEMVEAQQVLLFLREPSDPPT